MFYNKAKKYLALSLLLPCLAMFYGNISVFAGDESTTFQESTQSESEGFVTESGPSTARHSKDLVLKHISDVYENLYRELKWDIGARIIPHLKNDTRSLREIYNADVVKTYIEKKGMDVEIANRVICELRKCGIYSKLLVVNISDKSHVIDHVAVITTLSDGTDVIVDLGMDMEAGDIKRMILDYAVGLPTDFPTYYYPYEYVETLKNYMGKIRSMYIVDEDVTTSKETFRSCKKIWMHPDTGAIEGNNTLNIPLRIMGKYTIPSSLSSRKNDYFSLLTGHCTYSGTLDSTLIPISWEDFEQKYILSSSLDTDLKNLTEENREEYERDKLGNIVGQLSIDGYRLSMEDADRFMSKYYGR